MFWLPKRNISGLRFWFGFSARLISFAEKTGFFLCYVVYKQHSMMIVSESPAMLQMAHPEGQETKADEVHAMLLTVIRSLVDRPDDVTVSALPNEVSTTYRVQAHPADMGKLIGVNGRTARALRIILGANAARLKRNLSLDIVQADGAATRTVRPE